MTDILSEAYQIAENKISNEKKGQQFKQWSTRDRVGVPEGRCIYEVGYD